MGCGCSNNNNLLLSETKIKKNNLIKTGSKNNENVKSNNIYKNFKFKIDFKENEDELLNNNIKNILLYTTSYNPSGNLFIYLDNAYKNIVETYSFRDTALGLTLIYEKGMKINDYINKDKFFVLINDDFEIYILLDGHGPFGDIIAQKVQDKVFSYFIKEENQDLKDNYEKIFNSLYEEIQNFLVSNDKYNNDNEYDCILSGTSLTIIIKKDNFLYCSNVGNVTCFLYFVDQNIPSRFNIDILTINDSNLELNLTEHNIYDLKSFIGKKLSLYEAKIKHVYKNYNYGDEIRRIYEFGGELRKIADEKKQRIFVKGEYYPGVINSRSLGDRIANCIGVISKPHCNKYKLKHNINYKLFLYTDGIGNNVKKYDIVNIIRNQAQMNIFNGIKKIIDEAHTYFDNQNYSPDMTIIIKEFKID